MYEVVSFTRCRKGGLRQDIPLRIDSEESALRAARRLAASKALVLAIERGDAVEVLAAFGDVPDEIADMCGG